jgi:hypothetical protein
VGALGAVYGGRERGHTELEGALVLAPAVVIGGQWCHYSATMTGRCVAHVEQGTAPLGLPAKHSAPFYFFQLFFKVICFNSIQKCLLRPLGSPWCGFRVHLVGPLVNPGFNTRALPP